MAYDGTQINSLAEEAAISAIDAHGADAVPAASVAYAFIYQLHNDLEDEPMPEQLTAREFRQFKHDYMRHLRVNGATPEALAWVAKAGRGL